MHLKPVCMELPAAVCLLKQGGHDLPRAVSQQTLYCHKPFSRLLQQRGVFRPLAVLLPGVHLRVAPCGLLPQ